MNNNDFLLVEVEKTCGDCDSSVTFHTYKFLWEDHQKKSMICNSCGEDTCTIEGKLLDSKIWKEAFLDA